MGFFEKAFTFIIALLIVLLVGWMVVDTTLESAVGNSYTEEKWWIAEQYHCAKQGMEAEQYLAERCSFFGCHTAELTKCVSDNRELKIDYDDEIFCQYTLKGDWDWC